MTQQTNPIIKPSTTALVAVLSVLLAFCGRGYEPPTKDRVLADSSMTWKKDSSEHFDFYFESGRIPIQTVDLAKRTFEKKYAELLQSLEIEGRDRRLSLFMIESRGRMKRVVGLETNGIANVEDHTVFSIFNDSVKTLGIHEFCHIVTTNQWGKTKEVWLSEGLAVYSDNVWWGFELHPLAYHLQSRGKLVPIQRLIDNFRGSSSIVSYPECGSFVKFIREKYGVDILKRLWIRGTIVFEKDLNKTLPAIEQEWLQEIRRFEATGIDYEEKVASSAAVPRPRGDHGARDPR